MPLGVINGTARLEEHDPMWAQMAKDMILELRSVLGKDAIDIQHVGSTSIRGIPAKPLLDIAVAVDDVSIAEKYIEPLAELGLHYMGEVVKEQRMFSKSNPGRDDRTHHIHFVQYGSTRWTDYLNFRDYCNTHPDVAKAYADLKRELAEKYANDRCQYRDNKDTFIKTTLKQAAVWREENKNGRCE